MSPYRSIPIRLIRPQASVFIGKWMVVLFGCFLLSGRICAQETKEPEILTGAGQYWALGDEARQQSHPVRMEFTVTYYDASWSVLWGESDGMGFFLPIHGRALPMRGGQRVRLEGKVTPARGFAGEDLTVTVLDNNAWTTPLPAAGRLDDIALLDTRRVLIEGYVFRQREVGPAHVNLQMISEGRLISVQVLMGDSDPVPQFLGARVRLKGLYVSTRDVAGGSPRIDIWVPRMADTEIIGWLVGDERFLLPRTPIDQLAEAASRDWVRVVGTVKAQEVEKSITVRDEAGQLLVETMQPETIPPGTTVEVVGRPRERAGVWTLVDPIFRQTLQSAQEAQKNQPAENQASLMKLRLADQVLALNADEADRRYPVALRGVVTWSDERQPFFYLQDASGGICIRRDPAKIAAPAVGSALLVSGFSKRGAFAPEVELATVTEQGLMVVPPARALTLEQAQSGAQEGRWVEMRGYLYRVEHDRDSYRLLLATSAGDFSAEVRGDESLEKLSGAMVRVAGVCTALTNSNRQLTGIRLLLPAQETVTVEVPPADPFASPLQTISSLRQFAGQQSVERTARLTGTVLLALPGAYLYLQDESGGILVLSRDLQRWSPGTRVEVAGLPGRAGSRQVLREAVVRAAKGPGIAPHFVEKPGVIEATLDARLVSLTATLQQVVAEEDSLSRLTLQADGVIFDAKLRSAAGWPVPQPGSLLELTGVYVVEYDEHQRPRGFELELRAPADVRLLEAPAWWNARRAFYVAGGFAVCALAILAWVVALRRRVQAQTEQIRRQLDKELRLRAELERSSRLESLGVLAGGIAHDFNNLLTTILGNLGLAAMDKRVLAAAGDCVGEAERAARRARVITQQLLTFAKGGDPVRAPVHLPDLVAEAANFARHGSKVRFDFDFPPDLPAGQVDAGQISRVVHNLVQNAVQAMPDGGEIHVGLAEVTVAAGEVETLAAGKYIRLTVTDTGKGIAPEALTHIFDPYFSTKGQGSGLGLATVRSIVKKHDGHVDVRSQPGQGTTFRVWLPAAGELPPAPAPAAGLQAASPARILLMDDEEAILSITARVLSLASHEVVTTRNGREAIAAFKSAREAGRSFDVVIFDLNVPGGMGGKEALQELLPIDPEVRAVAASGYSNDPIMANPLAFGFFAAMPKPYDIPELLRVVEKVRRS